MIQGWSGCADVASGDGQVAAGSVGQEVSPVSPHFWSSME